jgi:hypothetical protein
MYDATLANARKTSPLTAAASTKLPEVLTTVLMIRPVSASAITRLEEQRKAATCGEEIVRSSICLPEHVPMRIASGSEPLRRIKDQ